MYRSVYLKNGELDVDRQAYVKKHKIIYHTPQYKGYDGLPIGNGTFGGMVYQTKETTKFVLNHADAICFAKEGNFDAWSWESEENNTGHVSCANMTITDHMPSFDILYLNEYQATLDIADGLLQIDAETPFSKNQISAYVNETYQVEVIQFESCAEEEVERVINLNRWGSRNLFHDYEQISPDTTKNLGETYSGQISKCIYVTQNVSGCSTATLLYLGNQNRGKSHRLNSHEIEYIFEKQKEIKQTIFARVLVAQNPIDIEKEVSSFESDVNYLTYESVLEEQDRHWREYWNQSFIYLGQDDYLENIYYMYVYIMESCSKGKYPITFGSIWCHNHDTRNWGHYYHWNHQQIYWGLHAAGKSALVNNYLEYRFAMLAHAIEDGEKLFGVKGAFFSDISNYNGYQALEPDTVRNFTCGAQIALDFYRHFQYTRDYEFLKQRAFPLMKAVMALYEGVLIYREGYYEMGIGATCYESYWNLKQTITDRMMIIALVDALVETVEQLNIEEKQTNIWLELKEKIYNLPITQTQLEGKEVSILSAGLKWNGDVVSYRESEYPMNTFGLCQLCGVFPANVYSLNKKNKEWELAKNTFQVMARDYVYEVQKTGSSGHSTAPIVAARLGMREDTMKILHLFVERYQCFKNGLCHFANIKGHQFWSDVYYPRVIEEGTHTDWETVHEKQHGNRVALDTEELLHCYFEAQAEIFTGINEMMLQSYDRILHVFPSTPEKFTGAFCLQAVGGFSVTSEIHRGEVRYIVIKARKEEKCTVRIPWRHGNIRLRCEGTEIEWTKDKGVLSFIAKAGGSYLLENCEAPIANYYKNEIPYTINTEPKYYAPNQIGCERRF